MFYYDLKNYIKDMQIRMTLPVFKEGDLV